MFPRFKKKASARLFSMFSCFLLDLLSVAEILAFCLLNRLPKGPNLWSARYVFLLVFIMTSTNELWCCVCIPKLAVAVVVNPKKPSPIFTDHEIIDLGVGSNLI